MAAQTLAISSRGVHSSGKTSPRNNKIPATARLAPRNFQRNCEPSYGFGLGKRKDISAAPLRERCTTFRLEAQDFPGGVNVLLA